jgi:two-component system cell cycle response regulator DivK
MRKVLVVDEFFSIRELIRIVLEHSGYSVFEAASGAEALRSAREFLPDLIIFDLDMRDPDMPDRDKPSRDGFGAVKELRRDPRFETTPIIAFTADAWRGGRERALSAGFTSYLAKSIGLSSLQGEVERLFGEEIPSVSRR